MLKKSHHTAPPGVLLLHDIAKARSALGYDDTAAQFLAQTIDLNVNIVQRYCRTRWPAKHKFRLEPVCEALGVSCPPNIFDGYVGREDVAELKKRAIAPMAA